MSCPALEQLAACAAEDDAEVASHAAGCPRCAAILRDQREAIELARRAPMPTLGGARRAELAAELLARAEVERPPHRGTMIAVAASLAAAAGLAIALFAARHAAPAVHPRAAAVAPPAPVARAAPAPAAPVVAPVASAAPAIASGSDVPRTPVAPAPAPQPRALAAAVSRPTPPSRPAPAPQLASDDAGSAAPRPAAVNATGGDLTRATFGGVDTIAVRDGVLAVDATDRAPVSITTRDTTVDVAQARAEVVARGGVIISTRVFAGSVEITSGGVHQVIEAGAVWTPPPGPATSLAAFRAGWEALNAGHEADAIAAFDRATDPVVAEDAAFWAAIATLRTGDRAGARTRLHAFLSRFPHSPRAADARAALERLR